MHLIFRCSIFIGAAAVVTVFALFPLAALALIDGQLDRGDQNADVTELQGFLAQDESIYPEGLITGYFGPLTQAAVQRYQCQEDIVCEGTSTSTGYGRVGPLTMASINADMGVQNGTGGPDVDVSAPVMFSANVSTSSTSATITWTTNEPAQGRVMYGTTWPFLYAQAPSITDTDFDTVQSVTIPNLTPDTTYYFVRESVDMAGNLMWTTMRTFRTGS